MSVDEDVNRVPEEHFAFVERRIRDVLCRHGIPCEPDPTCGKSILFCACERAFSAGHSGRFDPEHGRFRPWPANVMRNVVRGGIMSAPTGQPIHRDGERQTEGARNGWYVVCTSRRSARVKWARRHSIAGDARSKWCSFEERLGLFHTNTPGG